MFDKLRKTYISERWIFYALLILVIASQSLFIKELFIAIQPVYNNENNIAINYTNNNFLDYKVILKNNSFINEEKDSDAFIFDFVDHISINNKYTYKADRDSDIKGKYIATAVMKVYYKESSNLNSNPKIWQISDKLREQELNYLNSQFSIDDEIDIFFDKYREKLTEFQKKVNVAVDGYLEINFQVLFDGLHDGKNFTEDNNSSIKIPLNGSVFKIEKNFQEQESKKIYLNNPKLELKKIIILIILNIVCFISLAFLIKIIFFTKYTSKYKRMLDSIYKDYDDIIVNTKNMSDISKYDIIEITEFKELLNLSRESTQPIIGYELEDKSATWFYIIRDNILYRYIVTNKEKMIQYNYDYKAKKKH